MDEKEKRLDVFGLWLSIDEDIRLFFALIIIYQHALRVSPMLLICPGA